MRAMSNEIQFGTDGWRAVIADGFTFANVRLVADAIAVTARGLEAPDGVDANRLIVGFDRRFLSPDFAYEVAAILRDSGYEVILSTAPTPSQTISFSAVRLGAIGGVMVTASHNPAKYNGLKFKGSYGGSALPETYAAIGRALGTEDRRDGGSLRSEDLLADYVLALREKLDIGKLSGARLSILHDPIYGVASGLPERVLEGSEARVTTMRGEHDPSFLGVNPEPIPGNLGPSIARMKEGGFDLAICNDGDADRVGILDENGVFVSPHKLIALLALYMVRRKGMTGEIVKTFSTSRIVENVARGLGVKFHETPIGFKYVADLMLTRDILIGGEESGGVGFGWFLPERDGILSGLLVAECIADAGRPLSVLVREMEEEFGTLHYDRRDLLRPQAAIDRLIEKVRDGGMDSELGGEVTSREEKDGVKLNFADGGWILFRKSGTEPIIRIYAESPSQVAVASMLARAAAELEA